MQAIDDEGRCTNPFDIMRKRRGRLQPYLGMGISLKSLKTEGQYIGLPREFLDR